MHQYLVSLLDPFVTLLEIHKLMYFMQEAGEPLKLRYEKAPYGPYAENLRHVLSRSRVTSYRATLTVATLLTNSSTWCLVPSRTRERSLEGCPETRLRFDRVSDLVEGFESSFGWNCCRRSTGSPQSVRRRRRTRLSPIPTHGARISVSSLNGRYASRSSSSETRAGLCRAQAQEGDPAGRMVASPWA